LAAEPRSNCPGVPVPGLTSPLGFCPSLAALLRLMYCSITKVLSICVFRGYRPCTTPAKSMVILLRAFQHGHTAGSAHSLVEFASDVPYGLLELAHALHKWTPRGAQRATWRSCSRQQGHLGMQRELASNSKAHCSWNGWRSETAPYYKRKQYTP